jgi:CBS domain-containing protein
MEIPKTLYSALTSVRPAATVREAASVMRSARVGAVVVLDAKEHLAGILSERDIMTKVVAEDKDPAKTAVGDVMVSPVITVTEGESLENALRFMAKRHIRHLPVVNGDGAPIAILSIRDLLRHRIEELGDENETLAAFISADGPGG